MRAGTRGSTSQKSRTLTLQREGLWICGVRRLDAAVDLWLVLDRVRKSSIDPKRRRAAALHKSTTLTRILSPGARNVHRWLPRGQQLVSCPPEANGHVSDQSQALSDIAR